jgi:hypothetical protein
MENRLRARLRAVARRCQSAEIHPRSWAAIIARSASARLSIRAPEQRGLHAKNVSAGGGLLQRVVSPVTLRAAMGRRAELAHLAAMRLESDDLVQHGQADVLAFDAAGVSAVGGSILDGGPLYPLRISANAPRVPSHGNCLGAASSQRVFRSGYCRTRRAPLGTNCRW